MLVGCWSIESTDQLILRIPTPEVERDLDCRNIQHILSGAKNILRFGH